MPIGRRPEPIPEKDEVSKAEEEQLAEAQRSIGERVQFWEEQDKINQALIPRVIRLHEILTEHLQDHPDISEISAVVDRTLAQASRELRRDYKEALASADRMWKAESRKQTTNYQDALAATSREHHQTLQEALSAATSGLRSDWQASLHTTIANLHHESPIGLKRLRPIVKVTLITSTLVSITSLALVIYLILFII